MENEQIDIDNRNEKVSVDYIFNLPNMPKFKLIAGKEGLDNEIKYVSVYEVADAYKWLEPKHLILTTFTSVSKEKYQKVFMELSKQGTAGIILFYSKLYYKEIPSEFIELCNKYQIPLFLADKKITYSEIIFVVMQTLINRKSQQDQLRISIVQQINKILLNGGNIHEFAKLIYNSTGDAVLILDKNYQVLACYTSKEFNNVFVNNLNNIISTYMTKDNNMEVIKFAYKELSFSAYPIILNNTLYGHIILYKKNLVDLSDTTSIIIKQCAQTIIVSLIKYETDQEYRQSLISEMFRLIIENKQLNEQNVNEIERVLRNFKISTKHGYRFLFIRINNDICKNNLLKNKIQDQILFCFGENIIKEMDGYYLAIVADSSKLSVQRSIKWLSEKLTAEFDKADFAISSSVKEINLLNKIFRSSKNIIYNLRCMFYDLPEVICCDEYNEYAYLTDLFEQSRNKNIDWSISVLKPLLDYDLEKGGDLYNDLKLFLFYDKSIKEVSEIEFVHKNTLHYRINKIKQLLGVDSFSEKRFIYLLAIAIYEYFGINKTTDSDF